MAFCLEYWYVDRVSGSANVLDVLIGVRLRDDKVDRR